MTRLDRQVLGAVAGLVALSIGLFAASALLRRVAS